MIEIHTLGWSSDRGIEPGEYAKTQLHCRVFVDGVEIPAVLRARPRYVNNDFVMTTIVTQDAVQLVTHTRKSWSELGKPPEPGPAKQTLLSGGGQILAERDDPNDWLALFIHAQVRDPEKACSCSGDCDRERAAAYAEIMRLRAAQSEALVVIGRRVPWLIDQLPLLRQTR